MKAHGPAIVCEDLHVAYRSLKGRPVEAVRGLSFEVQPGEVVGFLGPNGAGKSSTLKSLMGFVKPTSGRCEVAGFPAASLESKAHVGYLPEVAMYYPYLTPIETLTLYGELQGLRGRALREEALGLLAMVGLSHAIKKQNRQLSKGMLQRVGIAQALLGSPSVLIMDEVTSGLDPIGRHELRSLLRRRQEAGCTLFFSSHELGEVEALCDRLLLIDQGCFVEERTLEDIKSDLRRFRLVYRGAASMLGLSEEWSEVSDDVYEVELTRRDQLVEAIERVHRSGGRVVDVEAHEGSLEEYFVNRVGRVA